MVQKDAFAFLPKPFKISDLGKLMGKISFLKESRTGSV